jgi:peptidoglycan/LPS O-acetylase OafA/YrhL
MPKERLDALTGLRFVAAFAIVWLHADLYFDWASGGRGYPLALGVSFFFVLSGFILAHAYGGRSVSYGDFIKGRIARLWPLHAACLLAVFMFVRSDSQSFDGPGIFSKAWSFVANILLLQSWVPTTSYIFSWNSVSWSISTELFFYATFPLLLMLLRRSVFLVIAAGIVPLLILGAVVWWLGIPTDGGVFDVTTIPLFYAFPPARLLEFCIGIACYHFWAAARHAMPATLWGGLAVEVALFACMFFYFTSGAGYFGSLLSWSESALRWYSNGGASLLFAALIFVMASSQGPIGRILGTAPMIWLGEISFAIYMTHQIVMKVLVLSYPGLEDPALVLAAVLLAAAVGHYAIERPAQTILTRRRLHPANPATA